MRLLFLNTRIDVSTVNFFDDSTHLRTFDLGDLSALAEKSGFNPAETGVIGNRYIEDDLISFGMRSRDQELAT